MINYILDSFRGLFWAKKVFNKKKNLNLRINTSETLVCKLKEYPDISFIVENISQNGFLISPFSNQGNVIDKILTDFQNSGKEKFTVSFYHVNKKHENVDLVTVKARPILIEKSDISPDKLAFQVEKRDLSKFKKFYLSIFKEFSETTHFLPRLEKNTGAPSTCSSTQKATTENTHPYLDLIALSTVEEKKASIKEKKIKLLLYTSLFMFFIVSGLISDVVLKAIKESKLNDTIAIYEKETNSKVLFLIHKKQEVGLFGVPVYNYLKVFDAHKLLADLENVPKDKNLTIIIHSPGGELLAGIQISKALKEWQGEVTVVVPYFAMSAGTLISLSADKIVTKPTATFGPIDPQIPTPWNQKQYSSAVSIVEASRNKNNFSLNELSLIIDSKKALNHIERFLHETVLVNYTPEQRQKIIKSMLYTDRNHDFPFFSDELKQLGINITYETPESLKKLIKMVIS